VAFRSIEAEAMLTALREVAALSSGSACASGSTKGSYVIKAMGAGEERARCSIRFGLGRSNTEEDVDRVVDHVARAARRLRAISPLVGS
jgi:cysteine desulfurase